MVSYKESTKNNKLTQFAELKDIVIENSVKTLPENKKNKGSDRQLYEF